MSSLLKNLIIALSITIILGVVYYFTIGRGTGEDVSLEEGTTLSDSEIALRTQRILADIQRVDTYKLDVSILEDHRFESLFNFSVALTDVSTGRSNPFAPVE